MTYANRLLPLPAGTEHDHIEWEDANAFHRKSYHGRYLLAFETCVRPLLHRGPLLVIDAPCGCGIGTKYIFEQLEHDPASHRVIGIDLNAEAIAAAHHKYPGPHYIAGALPDVLQFAARRRPDAVVCMEFLEHVDAATARATVEAIAAILAPGGRAIFSSPRLRPREVYEGRSHHINEYYDEAFYYLIEEFFPWVERYSFDRYANARAYTPDANLMVAVAHQANATEVFVEPAPC